MSNILRQSVATRRVAVLVTGVLVAGSLSLASVGRTAAHAATATSALTTGAAQQLAAQTGKQILVASSVTPTDETFANPDGTMTLHTDAEPVRTDIDNQWHPINNNLKRDPDGMLSPIASINPIEFSGGGSAPLASITSGMTTLSWTWPTALPSPIVSGATAVYPNVLPGVDLQMTASSEGFADLLVVHSALAARQKALTTLKIGTSVSGGSESSTASGFTVNDSTGTRLFTSSAPSMWDSSGLASASRGVTAALAPDAERTRPASHAPAASTPADGTHVAAVAEHLGGSTLRLVPNAAMLSSSRTIYPVYIDPIVSSTKSAWGMVDKSFPSTSYYKWTDTDQGDGYQDFSGVDTKRLYWRFTTKSLLAPHTEIISASFTAVEDYSSTCAKKQVDLYSSAPFNSSLTWSTQPASQKLVDSETPLGVRPSAGTGCSTANQQVKFDASGAVAQAITNGWSYTSVNVRAHSETDDTSWKRFVNNSNTALSVTYDTAPNAPDYTQMGMTDPNYACSMSSSTQVGETQPTFFADNVTDPDGGNIQVYFQLWNSSSKLIWNTPASETAAQKSGSDFKMKYTGTLTNGAYTFDAVSTDGTQTATSKVCEFTVNTTAPPAPTVSATPYSADASAGGVGIQGSFLFVATSAASFQYSFNSTNLANTVAASGLGTAPVKFTPTNSGRNYVEVQAKSAAGVLSLPQSWSFEVSPAEAIGEWTFDDGPGSTQAADTAPIGPAHPMAVPSTTTWAEGADYSDGSCLDYALSFDGGGDQDAAGPPASTATTVINTAQSFSVSAWVFMDNETANQIAVSEGSTTESFTMGYSAGKTAFSFDVRGASGVTGVYDTRVNQDSEWVRLTGTYNATTQQIALWAFEPAAGDGAPAGPTATATAASATLASTGPLLVGDGSSTAGSTQYWDGSVDDLVVYQSLLSASDIYTLDTGPCTAAPPPPPT